MNEKNNKSFETKVDFSDVTPKVQIEQTKINPLYEKAFLDKDEKQASEYNQNGTTWD